MLGVFFRWKLGAPDATGIPVLVHPRLLVVTPPITLARLHCYKCCWQQRLEADNRSSFIMRSFSSPPTPSSSPPLQQQLVDKWCACVEWNATPPIRTVPSDVLTTVDVEASWGQPGHKSMPLPAEGILSTLPSLAHILASSARALRQRH